MLAEGGNVLRQRELHIGKLEADLKGFQESTNRELVQRLEWVNKVQAELESKQAEVVELRTSIQKLEALIVKIQSELDDRSKWAQELTRQVEEKDARILERQRAVETLEEELRQRSEWATSLARDLESTQEKLRHTTETALHLDVELAERTAWVQQLSREANALRTDLEVLLDSFWHRTGRLLRVSPRKQISPPALRPAPKQGNDA